MATNKRKDAAALFELLDKSTLKVPKSGSGPLKIPNWWSRASRAKRAAAENAGPAVAVGFGAGTPAPPQNPPKPVRPPDAPVSGPMGPGDLSRFLPQSNRWFLPVAAAAVMLFMLAVVYWASRSHKAHTSATNRPIGGPTGGDQPPRLSKVPGATKSTAKSGLGGNRGTHGNAVNGGRAVGRVVPINQVHREAGHWYLIIVTTRPNLAMLAAKHIAADGVSVTLQPVGKGMDQVVSINGYAKLSDPGARKFRRFVVQIGRDLPQAKRTGRGAWDDAYYARER